MRKGSGTFKCWAHRGVRGGGPTSGCCCFCWRAPLTVSFVGGMGVRMESTYSAASPAPPNRSQGVQSPFTSAAGACIGCCFTTGCCCSAGVAAILCVATASDCGLIASFAARGSARRLSWRTRLAAAPARPAETFLGSFILGTTGAGAGAVTLSTGTTCSTPFVVSAEFHPPSDWYEVASVSLTILGTSCCPNRQCRSVVSAAVSRASIILNLW